MTVLINVREEFGIKKPIEVKESNANMRKTFQFQRDLAKVQIEQKKQQDKVEKAKDDDKAAEAMAGMFDVLIGQLDSVQEYIVDILKLNEKNQEKLEEEFDFEQTIELASKISSKILKVETVEATAEGDDLKA